MNTPGSSTPLDLIVGIGNPGKDYADTRHNAGVWFVETLASRCGGTFRTEKKFQGKVASVVLADREIRLLVPDTYMNRSGSSVGALVHYYRIAADAMMIAHDEIDFPVGKVRFKQGGGLAGHNGLRDISASLGGTKEFNRLRIGVGHPGHQDGVTGHVLGKVSRRDRSMIEACIDEALKAMPLAVAGDWQRAMQQLHNVTQPFEANNRSDVE